MSVMTTLLLSLACLGITHEKRVMNDFPRCPVWMKSKAGLNGTVTCVCGDSIGEIVLCIRVHTHPGY